MLRAVASRVVGAEPVLPVAASRIVSSPLGRNLFSRIWRGGGEQPVPVGGPSHTVVRLSDREADKLAQENLARKIEDAFEAIRKKEQILPPPATEGKEPSSER